MVSLTDDHYLLKVESELTSMLKSDNFENSSLLDGDDDFSDLDALESEFSELGEFITESEEEKNEDDNKKVNYLIETLEKAQDLVSALRNNPGTEGIDGDVLQARLDQVESSVNQAYDLLKRLENEVKEIRKSVK